MADDSNPRTARSISTHDDSPPVGRAASGSGDPLAELARLIGQGDLLDKMRRDAAQAGHGGAPALAAVAEAPPAQRPSTHDWTADSEISIARDLRGSFEPEMTTRRAPPTDLDFDRYREGDAGYARDAAQPYATAGGRSQATPRPIEETYAVAPGRGGYADPAQRGGSHARTAYSEAAYAAPEHADAPQTGAAYGSAAPYDPRYADADPAYDPAYDEHAYVEEMAEPERRRGGLVTIGAVVGLAFVGTAGAFGYWAMSGGSTPGEPPVISANTSPSKVAPAPQRRDGPSGFDRSRASGQGERVVSREEQPVELQQPRAASPRMMGQGSQMGTVGLAGQSTAAMVPPTTTGSTANPDAPRRVKTIPIRPDTTAAPEAAARPAPASPPTRMAALPPPATTAPAAGGHVVQVASQRSEQDAQASFKALQAKYPNVLGGREAMIRRIDLGDRGIFFRVQVGPFASADQANGLCDNLKAAGGQCIVQRN
jgi:hypothetical protein